MKKKKTVSYTVNTLPPLTAAQRANLKRLAARLDQEIDTTEIPEMTDAQWKAAKRGDFYRPVKRQITARVDADVLNWLKAQGKAISRASTPSLDARCSKQLSSAEGRMRTIFVRHGQSTGNAGIPCPDLALLELTELGGQQAREVAASWAETPTLIVTSPYLRTQQTAAPTMARFPNVPVEVWPIQEFTYLQPSRWNGTRSSERMPTIERYWAEAAPEFCDGEGAESFATLLQRAEAALTRLAAMPEEALVYVFSHGQFIQAVRSVVIDSELSSREKMRRFWRKGSPAIANAERVELFCHGGVWRHRAVSIA